MAENKVVAKKENSFVAGLKGFFKYCKKNPSFTVGLIIMVALLFIAIFAEQIAPNDPYQNNPKVMLRAPFEEPGYPLGTDNLGLNLDTANPILYGKANPVDMMEMLGDYVCDVHIKDGMWPTDGWNLGKETPVGQGKVDFAKIIRMLKDRGYDGALTIEREISGDEQIRDILSAKALLEKLLAEE